MNKFLFINEVFGVHSKPWDKQKFQSLGTLVHYKQGGLKVPPRKLFQPTAFIFEAAYHFFKDFA